MTTDWFPFNRWKKHKNKEALPFEHWVKVDMEYDIMGHKQTSYLLFFWRPNIGIVYESGFVWARWEYGRLS